MILAVAACLLLLSALLVFGWPLLWAVPGQRVAVLTGSEARFLAGSAGAIVLMVVVVPTLAGLAHPGAEAVYAAFDATYNFVFDL
ncbi:MAG: hypothetical protein AAFO57_06165 [Pseudomonadota bacterium]